MKIEKGITEAAMEAITGRAEPSSSSTTGEREEPDEFPVPVFSPPSSPRSDLKGLGYEYDYPNVEDGVTALGFIYRSGVMVAVDHYSTSDPFPENVHVLTKNFLLVTISGGSNFPTDKMIRDLKCLCQDGEGRPCASQVSEWVSDFVNKESAALPDC
ncbi:OLC1v1033076C1 [Oldenlandia corymbosa var. corymbosa]|uniref:OLC1v1033076C1 n=1 Tax=Oldenlandia corymbosa var. corymbosa TaxID=529605 RepID=A0AAV1CN47_OLDCO|nr:OLC1v1033076C1 [Oldenlandia corymbosa var. corymbosa]